MNIDALDLFAAGLPAQRDFYAGVLGLPAVEATPGILSLRAGSSRLTFRQAPDGWSGVYHFAFNIPENQFREAKSWLSGRVALIKDATGADEFRFESWNAHSVYFYDPAGNILELIARHNLENSSNKPFGDESLLAVSEIGLATEDVPGTVRLLQKELGAGIYDGAGSDMFTAVGDEHGLVIVVKRSRAWFPDTGKPAELVPLKAVISNKEGARFELAGPPYRIHKI
jgi:catechol-2,3-dioxygenase